MTLRDECAREVARVQEQVCPAYADAIPRSLQWSLDDAKTALFLDNKERIEEAIVDLRGWVL
jgi:hypothetical protein